MSVSLENMRMSLVRHSIIMSIGFIVVKAVSLRNRLFMSYNQNGAENEC